MKGSFIHLSLFWCLDRMSPNLCEIMRGQKGAFYILPPTKCIWCVWMHVCAQGWTGVIKESRASKLLAATASLLCTHKRMMPFNLPTLDFIGFPRGRGFLYALMMALFVSSFKVKLSVYFYPAGSQWFQCHVRIDFWIDCRKTLTFMAPGGRLLMTPLARLRAKLPHEIWYSWHSCPDGSCVTTLVVSWPLL